MIKYLIIVFLVINSNIYSQTNLSITELNKKLGKGINMGNMFEAPSESEWGNPYKNDYFQKISATGFNHVRIPIRWDVPARTSQTAPYTINPTFLERIKTVVDNAIANNLYVVINMHHHEGLFANPEKDKAKFLAQWAQIAEYFKGYDQKLLFEVMNEPHDKLTTAVWNVYFKEALAVIRKTNPTRGVVMGLAEYGGLAGLPGLIIPEDPNIILTIHYYNPFNFTHQGAEWIGGDANSWLGTKWEDLEVERKQIYAEFAALIALSKQKNIPIHIGEFGAYSKADIASRTKWTTFLARWFEQQGWSWGYWEWSAGFGIYDPNSNKYNTNLVDALIKNPLPEAKKLPTKVLYNSDFNADNNGWTVNLQPNSDAALSRNNGSIVLDVKTAVKDGWHVQFTKNNIALELKKRYLVTIKASANKPISITSYMGKTFSPYDAYSSYSSLNIGTIEQEFSYTFVMNEASDKAARMSFDAGSTIAKINFSLIKIEEVLDENTTPVIDPPIVVVPLSNEKEIDQSIKISPNPIKESANIYHSKSINTIALRDSFGRILFSKNTNSNTNTTISLKSLPNGIYYVSLFTENKEYSRKILKQ